MGITKGLIFLFEIWFETINDLIFLGRCYDLGFDLKVWMWGYQTLFKQQQETIIDWIFILFSANSKANSAIYWLFKLLAVFWYTILYKLFKFFSCNSQSSSFDCKIMEFSLLILMYRSWFEWEDFSSFLN